MWEFMFPGVDKNQLLIPEAEDDLDNLDDDEVCFVSLEKSMMYITVLLFMTLFGIWSTMRSNFF